MIKPNTPLLLLAGLMTATGCGWLAVSDDDAELDSDAPELECTAGLSEDAVAAHFAIAYDLQHSLHELVVCGALTRRLASAVATAILDTLVYGGGTPEGFSYVGDGWYRALTNEEGSSAELDVHFVLLDDYEFAAAGDPITEDLFAESSYLIGASASLDLEYLTIEYDAVGPLVELMGFGPNPPNPLQLTIFDIDKLNAGLADLAVEGEIIVYDQFESGSSIAYTVDVEPLPISQLVNGLEMTLVDVAGSDDEAQSLEVTTWNIDYADSDLTGNVDFDVGGGLFDWRGELVYQQGGFGELTLDCR